MRPKRELLARRCYDHLGGRLGAALLELYLKNGWIVQEPGKTGAYRLTAEGRRAFAGLGLELLPEEPGA